MNPSRYTAATCVESLKLETMDMVVKDVDRDTYVKIGDEIKLHFGMESCAIFRNTVKGENGQFWIEPDDFAHMWRRMIRASIIKT